MWYDLTGWLDIKEVWIGCLEDELVRPNTTFVVEVTEAIEAVEVGRMTADVRFGDRVVSVVDILGTEIPEKNDKYLYWYLFLWNLNDNSYPFKPTLESAVTRFLSSPYFFCSFLGMCNGPYHLLAKTFHIETDGLKSSLF